jgi:hypothetical protein
MALKMVGKLQAVLHLFLNFVILNGLHTQELTRQRHPHRADPLRLGMAAAILSGTTSNNHYDTFSEVKTMSGIGPELPPHLLAKRKRRQEEEVEDGPAASSGAKRPASPTDGEKRRRVMGPAMPPAPLDQRPSEPANDHEDSDSDDDDGFGPSLPPASTETADEDPKEDNEATTARPHAAPLEAKPKRDDWMMMPPKQDDLAARMDPTKQRARGFNTGKGAKGRSISGGDNSTWNETPEQKQSRLADEMMGISQPLSIGTQRPPTAATARDEAAAKQIKEHTVSCELACVHREMSSLMELHRTKHVDHLYWYDIRRAKVRKQKTIRARELSIARKTWAVGCELAMSSDSRCSTKRQTIHQSSRVAHICDDLKRLLRYLGTLTQHGTSNKMAYTQCNRI